MHRRTFLTGATGMFLAACSGAEREPQSIQKPAPRYAPTPFGASLAKVDSKEPSKPEPLTQTEIIRNEVRRLAPQIKNPKIQAVYTEPISKISSDLKDPLQILTFDLDAKFGVAQTSINLEDAKWTNEPRFTLRPNRGDASSHRTVTGIGVSIAFHPEWTTYSDKVKVFVMEKEGYHVHTWPLFVDFIFALYATGGEFEKIDPTVTDKEMATSITHYSIKGAPHVQKLLDYSGYLAMMPQIEQMEKSNDVKTMAELASISNVIQVYYFAKEARVVFPKNIESSEFARMAFTESPWTKMVLDPKVAHIQKTQ